MLRRSTSTTVAGASWKWKTSRSVGPSTSGTISRHLTEILNVLANSKNTGDVYLLGSTNTGKSTLFNALLQSDYCKSHVRDLIHRATTSIWSGTTLNLLKFPIMNPEPWKLVKRRVRLLKAKSEEMEEKKIEKRSTTVETKPYSETILTANIEATDLRGDLTIEKEAEEDNKVEFVGFERTKSGEVIDNIKDSDNIEKKKYSDLEKQFINVRWLYDTPGVIKTEQIVNLLKPEEVKCITPKKRLIPRVFMLKPGEVMFITGLSRLDYIQGQNPIAITVFTDMSLPVITLKSSDADSYYSKHIGGSKLKVPIDNTNHLPSLVARYFELVGNGTRTLTADIQLSSLGWVSVAIQRADVIGLRVYTPGGYGCHLRETPVLSNYKKFQGPRIKGTNRYKWTIPS
ncbi:nitric oxide-associated protein 1 [Patella vulgata]|uniref:nitric oxide-associated protein 1 n=1 Tax=Patella vulgata TaxID=6465 RepID=UPI0024A7F034|nr:nitric oxide-associated protein 1 [Patella vulgata]